MKTLVDDVVGEPEVTISRRDAPPVADVLDEMVPEFVPQGEGVVTLAKAQYHAKGPP